MSLINALNAASIPVYNAQVPAEGPKTIPLTLDWAAVTEIDLDGSLLTSNGFISMIQTMFIDTTGLAANLVVTFAGSNQSLNLKPNTQGYYPVLVPNPFRIAFACTNGNNVKSAVQLINVPIAPAQWSTV